MNVCILNMHGEPLSYYSLNSMFNTNYITFKSCRELQSSLEMM